MGILKYKDKNGNWVTATAVAQDIEGVLKYTTQTLTDEQKLQARTNIGFEDAVNKKIEDVVRYTNQTLNDEQKTQIKTNIGLNDAITLSNIENNATEIKAKLEITTSGRNYFLLNCN